MLQSRNLDDQRYRDIVDHAVGRIPLLCPQWTNHNPSDPGITLIELMAWYKEMQQYHMNRCTVDIRRKLLKLAGGDIRPAAAARCGIEPIQAGNGWPALSRLETPEGIVFELTEEISAWQASIAAFYVEGPHGRTDISAMIERPEADIRPFAFGAAGKTDFLIAFDALPEGRLRLWFQVRDTLLTPRNPFVRAEQTPRRIRWQMDGLGQVEPVLDETHALSESGYICFDIPPGWEKTRLDPDAGEYWCLRAVLEDPGCEETVCINGVSAVRYQAVQRETWSQSRLLTVAAQPRCQVLFSDALAAVGAFTVFLRTAEGWEQVSDAQEIGTPEGRGVRLDSRRTAADGRPNLRLVCSDPIHYADLFHDSTGQPGMTVQLELGGRQAVSFALICDTRMEDGSVRPEVWRCVEDFYASGPRDRVFVYDPVQETIRFGDGRHGAIVPRGQAAVFVMDLALSDCGEGNIPEESRLFFTEGRVSVRCMGASGGRHRESIDDAAARFLIRLNQPDKCVSAEDYELQARKTPGLRVASARAIPGFDPLEPTGKSRHSVVSVVVIPASESSRPLPDSRFLAAVQAHLNRLRPICTVVRVVAPRYIGVSVSAQLRASGPVEESELCAAVEDCLAVREGGRSIGDMVLLNDVSMALQRLEAVLSVSRIELRADGMDCVRSGTGDLLLPQNAAAYLKDCDFSVQYSRSFS